MVKKDPVCGMQVDEKKAPASSMHNGQRYVFCGQGCKDKFDANPEQYAGTESRQEQPQNVMK